VQAKQLKVTSRVRQSARRAVNPGELEVVWPLNRWHYLTVPDPDVPAHPPALASTWVAQSSPRSVSGPVASAPFEIGVSNGDGPDQASPGGRSHASVLDPTLQAGRALAVHAFLQGATCRPRRASALLGTHARTVGRDRTRPLLMAPPNLERAQALIAASADRGSTAEERAAAAAWLTEAARGEHQGEMQPAAKAPVSASVDRKAPVHARRPTRPKVLSSNGGPRNGSAATTAVVPDPPGPLLPVDALRRQQQRILHRATIIHYVLTGERQGGDSLTMGDALAELLADIAEAARTIGTLLPTTNGR
jgi:hypothetical protein